MAIAKAASQRMEIVPRALELSVIVRELMDLQVTDEKLIAMAHGCLWQNTKSGTRSHQNAEQKL
jgi:hypothetical protein